MVGSADQDLPYHHRTVNESLYVSPSAATVAAFSLSLDDDTCNKAHQEGLYENLLLQSDWKH